MLILILSLLCPTMLAAATSTPTPIVNYHDVTDAELEVYAAYLEKNFKPSKNDGPLARSAIIIENESVDAWQQNRRLWEAYLIKKVTGPGRASEACLQALLRRPQQTLRFFKFPATQHVIKLVRSDELSRTLWGGWDAFYEKWPGAQGFLSFGAIAFGPSGLEALFTVRSQCGEHCGFRDVAYMQKINGAWELILKESLP
jgi:hypothetical protein